MASTDKGNASQPSKPAKAECAKTLPLLFLTTSAIKMFSLHQRLQQNNAVGFMLAAWNAEVRCVWTITCFPPIPPTQSGNCQKHSQVSAIHFHGFDMCGHPHRNCNEPCKLWRHTPGKFLRIASSECWQKSSRDEWGCSRNVVSVGGPWQLECERSMELTASFLPSLLPLLVEPQKLGRITSIRVTLVPESTRGHNTGSHSQRHRDSKFHPPGVRWSVGTFARPIGSAFAFSQMNLLRDCYLRTHQILRGHTRIFARAYFLQLNYVAVAKTMCHVGIKSARPFIAPSSELQWGLTLTEPLRPTILTWTEQAGAMGGSSQLHRRQTPSPRNWWRPAWSWRRLSGSFRSFNLTTGNGKRSRLRRLRNGVPQGSVTAPLLFNISISDMPTTISRKYAYADDLAIIACWWRVTGSGSCAEQGHGNHRWIPPDLKVKAQHYRNSVGSLPPWQQGSQTWAESQLQQQNPAFLLRAQIPRSNVGQVAHVSPTPWVTSQEAHITRRAHWLLAGSGLGAGATTLLTATLALVHSAA